VGYRSAYVLIHLYQLAKNGTAIIKYCMELRVTRNPSPRHKKVQFGDLGTFYLSARTNGADTLDDFNISSNVKGIYLRFQPSRVDLNDLSSKTLKKRASFLNVKELAGLKDTEDSNDNE